MHMAHTFPLQPRNEIPFSIMTDVAIISEINMLLDLTWGLVQRCAQAEL